MERFLRIGVPLPEGTVDVSFEAPDRTWGASLTTPTINVFLWEVSRNPGRMRTGLEHRINDEGSIERRRTQPVVDLRYLVTAWATELADEHQLLGSLLTCILAHDRLPADSLPDHLAGSRCALTLATRDQRVPNEFWSSLDGRMKPGLQVEVSVPIEVFAWTATAIPAEEIGVNASRLAPAPARSGGDVPQPPVMRRRRSGSALVMEGRPGSSEPEG
ncbi:DUF4255 domain-containing protein [Acidiferrimicrobium sp. IK]|uniref:DUF4255 domain-containing protein n=1 Tax=Acidiferrimicrobium sp. IK TaxID=2871700 RepID=UPI0021CB3487|nr:DUF4255 domain-containing protein [Acidiferrimicrobium sp. IK]MCU4186056.1 DUF4255 domain-containing protein [Acidiferrimicrobium sp. IK]